MVRSSTLRRPTKIKQIGHILILPNPIDTMTPEEFGCAISKLSDERLVKYYKRHWRYFNAPEYVEYGYHHSELELEKPRITLLNMLKDELGKRKHVE